VTVRSPAEIYQWLIGAGFNPSSAVTMTAIAGAESSYNDDARGDLGIQTSVWGPSFGLFQIRTLKQKTGSGDVRDIASLTDPARQAKAAFDISKGGTDFTPWSTYTSGSYRKFLGTAEAAGSTNATTDTAQNVGLSLNPLDWLPDVKGIMIEGLFIVLGVGLVGAGLVRVFKPQINAAKEKAEAGAKVAASAANPAAGAAIAAADAKGKK